MASRSWFADQTVLVSCGIAVAAAVVCTGYFLINSSKSSPPKSSSTKSGSKTKSSSALKPSSSPSSSTSTSTSSSSKAGNSNSRDAAPNDSSGLRGYKKTADGRTTTYFNREISEEAKALIGDCTPKPISPVPIPATSSSSPALGRSCSSTSPGPGNLLRQESGSAWNAAGTWEELDCSVWARKEVQGMLRSAGTGSVSVESVQLVEGDASIATIRGKKKFIYDLNTSISWKVSSGGISASGKLTIADITGDKDYDFSITVESGASASKKKTLDDLLNAFKKSVSAQLDKFLEKFQAYTN